MLILGVHGGLRRSSEDNRASYGLHDAAAVLLRNGAIVAAVEQERIDRVKHSNYFPEAAIRRVLAIGGVRLRDVDRIATNWERTSWGMVALDEAMSGRAPRLGSALETAAAPFARAFGVDVRKRLRFVNHHVAHAWSALVPSGFTESLVVVLDGGGDGRSGLVLGCRGAKWQLRAELAGEQSLGDFYRDLIGIIGYRRFEEYKVMGLAPYGDPHTLEAVFRKLYTLRARGDFRLAPRSLWLPLFLGEGLCAPRDQRDRPSRKVRAFAAALQAMLETIVLHVVGHHARATKLRNLCVAGGLAHNCSLNGRLLYSGLFDAIYIQPAAHDAGGALGAALAIESGDRRAKGGSLGQALGTPLPASRGISRKLAAWGPLIRVRAPVQLEEEAALIMAAGGVIGWMEGRAEFGPRALGNRSILADPRPARNKDRINAAVKKREAYRPFAPAVCEELLDEYFERPPGKFNFDAMVFVVRVRPTWRRRLGAITHVDGTARVQAVSRVSSPRFWGLIDAFRRRTGVGVLLNTSFNNNWEPIVDSVDDGVTCFLTTDLDALFIGDHVVERGDLGALERLRLGLPSNRVLVRGDGNAVNRIESLASAYFAQANDPLSAPAFALLASANGRRTLGELLDATLLVGRSRALLKAELLTLWTRRCIKLTPSAVRPTPATDDPRPARLA